MATSTTRTRTTAILPLRTEQATPTHGMAVGCDPAAVCTGSRNPCCESSESGRADASILRDEEATSRPYSTPSEYALSPEGLYESARECFKGTDWKRSVAAFELNALERCIRLSEELNAGTYKARPPKHFEITRPKRRPCLSVGIRDRVYQRSLCDNVVYPEMVKSLIPANCACQKGKGTDYAIKRLKRMLRRHWHHHGSDGYILQMDIAGYYPNMRHDVVFSVFEKKLDAKNYSRVKEILSRQYAGDVGFDPGSQLVQIAGISALDGLDHYIKERLHVKGYIRYMDDMLCIGETREELKHTRDAISAYLIKLGWSLHPSKTRIQRINKRIPWLGFTFELKLSGYIVVRCRPEKIRDNRRRFRRMVQFVSRGGMNIDKADEIVYTEIRRLRKYCSNKADPEKLEAYWNQLKGDELCFRR